MRIWKFLIFIPYILIFLRIPLSYSILGAGLGGVILGTLGLAYGFIALMLYTTVLGVSLVIRWLILRSCKRYHQQN